MDSNSKGSVLLHKENDHSLNNKENEYENVDDIVLPTAEGLIRLREESSEEVNDINHIDANHDLFNKFTQESLHSFKFTSLSTETNTHQKKIHGTLPGHFRSSDFIIPISTNKRKTVCSPISKHHFRQTSLPPLSESPSSTISVHHPTSTILHDDEDEVVIPHLHHRLNQPSQAILTTYSDWHIIMTNDVAQEVLVTHPSNGHGKSLIGTSAMDLIEPSYQHRLMSIITNRKHELENSNDLDDTNGKVLVCGNVIPIMKLDGTKSAASLWLKEKMNESGSFVYIWIFEEVHESSIQVNIDDNGVIKSFGSSQSLKDLYDYEQEELIDKHLSIIIPSLTKDNWSQHLETPFFGSRTKREAQFPVIIKSPSPNCLQILSIPMIAGLMTIKANDGMIEGCNDSFAKYLFGYGQSDLVSQKTIDQLLPQFPILIQHLKRDDLLQPGLIINNIICRKMLITDNSPFSLNVKQRALTHTPNQQPLPIILALHRDGSSFEVQLQIKWVESSTDEYALWISFDRENTFKKYGHTKKPPVVFDPLSIGSQRKLNLTIVQPSKELQKPLESSRYSNEKDIVYSAQSSDAVGINNYDIVDTLGEGAYGLVKTAIKKGDSTNTKIVIKYVVKSRILVDCWTRDRKLGMLPAEIHILNTLRKHPHPNLVDMLDYFEDADYYYILMNLYDESIDLFDYIELNENTPEEQLCDMFRQIAEGVRHLHDLKIVHRDIKDENVILDRNGLVRLIDFGSAAYLKPGRKYETFVGTLDYAAPEILRGQTYSGKPQDIWALGILLFTLIYRENPFYSIDEIMDRELKIPYILSEGSVDLIRKMLERDVDKRIDIHEVLAHHWLS